MGKIGFYKGKKFSDDHRLHISIALKRYYVTHVHHKLGTKCSVEYRKKLSDARKRAWKNPVWREKVISGVRLFHNKNPDFMKSERNPFYGKHHSLEKRKYWSKIRSGVRPSMETRKLWSRNRTGSGNSFYGKTHSSESLSKILSSANHRPNKFETAVASYLELNFPNQWKYCGNGSVVLNGKCPDFINCNGKKEVILANGVFWHAGCKRPSSKLKKSIELRESKPYNDIGFDVIFIWEDDFKNNREGILCSVS